MNSEGELEGAPEPYSGHEDDGCQEFQTTYGTAYRAIARTPDEAVAEARRCWELSLSADEEDGE